MYIKLVPETVHYIKFHIKIYLQSFTSIYHLYHLFAIIYESIFYNSNIKSNYWFISKIINIWVTFSENTPCVPGIPSCITCPKYVGQIYAYWFSFFSVTTNLKSLLVFSYSNALIVLITG